jgi:DNA topoisomerase-1
MIAEDVDLALALRQLSLPRELGRNPDNNTPIYSHVGRYGDYVKSGEETRNLDATLAIDVSFEEALALLRMPKVGGKTMLRDIGLRESDGIKLELWRGRYGLYVTDGTYNKTVGDIDPGGVDVAMATAMLFEAKLAKDGKILGKDAGGLEVRVLKGRFGPFLTNGKINASLPKGMELEVVDLVFAMERLADFGKPVKKKGSGRKKAPAKKKRVNKKAPAKKKSAKKKA